MGAHLFFVKKSSSFAKDLLFLSSITFFIYFRLACCSSIITRRHSTSYQSTYRLVPSPVIVVGDYMLLIPNFNSIALRKANIAYNFGLSECSRVKESDLFRFTCLHTA